MPVLANVFSTSLLDVLTEQNSGQSTGRPTKRSAGSMNTWAFPWQAFPQPLRFGCDLRVKERKMVSEATQTLINVSVSTRRCTHKRHSSVSGKEHRCHLIKYHLGFCCPREPPWLGSAKAAASDYPLNCGLGIFRVYPEDTVTRSSNASS